MATVIPIKTEVFWNLTTSQYKEIDDLPLMNSPGLVLMILTTYLLFILKVGPNFMKTRKALKLTSLLLVYNAVQVALSAYLVWSLLRVLRVTGLIPTKCYIEDRNMRKEIIFCIWLYFAAKVTELADTVLFVLRKKDNQVTFLHVYHHSIMMIGTWVTLKYWPSETIIYMGFINSLVHVAMYSYYGLSALGPQMAKYLTWKKYITSFQLAQFVSVIIQYMASLKASECPPSAGIAVFIFSNVILFLSLFTDFYRQNYTKKSKMTYVLKTEPIEDRTKSQ